MANLALVKAKVAAADAQQGTGGLLTKKVDAAARGMMKKKVNPNQPWQVVLVVDASYSMQDEYNSGAVQDAVERALGFAVIVDDDGNVPVVAFDSRIDSSNVIDLSNFHGFIRSSGIAPRGSTNLSDALREVAKLTGNGDLFSGGGFLHRGAPKPAVQKMATPAFVIVVTDGVPDDPGSATDAIRRLSYRGVFFKFIYVGHDRRGWQYLESLDDDIPVGVAYEQGGRLIDNVDAKQFASLGNAPDDVFYDAMLDEVSTYLAAAKQNQLI